MSALLYEPLDPTRKSVRLIEVLPGTTGDSIRCQLTHADLDDRPSYIALSYTWDHNEYESIECSGAPFRVGRNLWNFLHRFREWDAARGTRLWVDAICINQHDVTERNHQVGQVRAVYSSAESTIAWLGEATSNEELVFLAASDALSYPTVEVTGATVIFLNKSYWSRIWVVQEFLLARSLEIWCGEYRTNEPYVSRLVWSLDFNRKFFRTAMGSPGGRLLDYRVRSYARKSSALPTKSFRLRGLLRHFSSSECSERYDKVYALLGLANDATEGPNPICPAYNKPAIEVFKDVLRNQRDERGTCDPDEIEFFDFLRRILGIPRMELARYMYREVKAVDSGLFMLATGIETVVSLRLTDKVYQWKGTERNNPKRSSYDTSLDQLDEMGTVGSYHNYHYEQNRWAVRSVIKDAAIRFVHAFIIRISSEKDDVEDVELHDTLGRNPEILQESIFCSLISAVKQCRAKMIWDAPIRDETGQMVIRNNTVGVNVIASTEFIGPYGAEIAVISDTTPTRTAFLLNPSKKKKRLQITSYVCVSQPISEESQEPQDRDGLTRPRLPDRLPIEGTVHLDLEGLLHACMAGYMDEQVLKRLLQNIQIKEDVAAEPLHRCLGDGNCQRVECFKRDTRYFK